MPVTANGRMRLHRRLSQSRSMQFIGGDTTRHGRRNSLQRSVMGWNERHAQEEMMSLTRDPDTFPFEVIASRDDGLCDKSYCPSCTAPCQRRLGHNGRHECINCGTKWWDRGEAGL